MLDGPTGSRVDGVREAPPLLFEIVAVDTFKDLTEAAAEVRQLLPETETAV